MTNLLAKRSRYCCVDNEKTGKEGCARLGKLLGAQLKGCCDRSDRKKWDMNWNSVGDGEERNTVKEVV